MNTLETLEQALNLDSLYEIHLKSMKKYADSMSAINQVRCSVEKEIRGLFRNQMYGLFVTINCNEEHDYLKLHSVHIENLDSTNDKTWSCTIEVEKDRLVLRSLSRSQREKTERIDSNREDHEEDMRNSNNWW